ncbi:MAG: hypothetical protein AAB443_01160 [Patescibacteria group bacterium]
MKVFLRNILFSYIVLVFLEIHFTGIEITFDIQKTLLLMALGLGIINSFAKALIKLVSLPSSGIFYLVLNFFVNLVAFFMLDKILVSFSILDSNITGLKLLELMINYFNVSVFWSYVIVSGVFSLSLFFLNFLCTSGKKK